MTTTASLDVPRSASPEQLDHLSQRTSISSAISSFRNYQHVATSSTRSLASREGNGSDAGTPSLPAAPRSRPQEMHIVKVTDDGVHIHTTPTTAPLLHTMETTLPQIVTHYHAQSGSATSGSSVGPPPPSPPASAEHMQDDDQAEEQDEFAEEAVEDREPESRTASTSYSPSIQPVIFERTGHQRQSSSSSSRPNVRTSPRPPHALSHRASVETKASFRTTGASTCGARSLNQSQSDGTSDTPYTG
ncbi:hypothetical protein EIP86_007553 [Pleurotus ostreatoroseus]|nr:hypothetical protein EIP86_007553 [Pleurotus ostreatoroseus]